MGTVRTGFLVVVVLYNNRERRECREKARAGAGITGKNGGFSENKHSLGCKSREEDQEDAGSDMQYTFLPGQKDRDAAGFRRGIPFDYIDTK